MYPDESALLPPDGNSNSAPPLGYRLLSYDPPPGNFFFQELLTTIYQRGTKPPPVPPPHTPLSGIPDRF